jgi:glycosyltransferase involved in cell wall biosynthesis
MPEHFGPLKRAYLRYMVPRSVRRADRIITLTDFVADDLAAKLNISHNYILRVPPCIRQAKLADPQECSQVRARYGLNSSAGAARPFFLYPATTCPHKNHLTLLEAFARVRRAHSDVVLVLTGAAAQSEHRVAKCIARLGLVNDVRRVGRIPRRDLDVLYQLAIGLTFASWYEGCAIPVLEAMAANCPVIASNTTGTAQMVDRAGILLRATDPTGWEHAMASLLADPKRRLALSNEGLKRSKQFSYRRSAEALADAYRAVTNEAPWRANGSRVAYERP